MSAPEVSLVSYVARSFLALALLSVFALVFVRVAKSRGWVRRSGARLEIMASLPLGKDVFFVLRCGPDVVALTSGRAGVCLIGRWRYEDWAKKDEDEKGEKGENATSGIFPYE